VSRSGEQLSTSDLRAYLRQQLPDYMIPAYFVYLDRIPLTPSGKVDRRALPQPELKAGQNYMAPRNEIETKLVELWSEILGRESLPGSESLHGAPLQTSIGIDDNFFELGGHSLKATLLAAKIHKVFDVVVPLAEIFKTPRIREISGYIIKVAHWEYEQIEAAEKKEYYLLSSAQKRLYFLQQMEKDGITYNITAIMIVAGILDKKRLEHSIRRLIERHESLRTSIDVIAEEPVQRIHEGVAFAIENVGEEENEENSAKDLGATIKSFIRPFALSHAPLLRMGLLKLAQEKYMLLVDMHHIISDGMSTQVLVQDFSALYEGKNLPGINVHYKDYAEWQNREKVNKKIRAQGDYWEKVYEGEIPVLDLPADYPRPVVKSFAGDSITFKIAHETFNALKVLALEIGATPYIVLLALYNVLLAKLSGQEEIIIGSPVAGRSHADLEKIIGMFVNTLAFRNYPSGEKRFIDFLEEVKEITLKGFENQEYPYEDLIEKIIVNRDVSRNPLFDTMFVLQNTGSQKIELPGLKLAPFAYENKTAKFDLVLSGREEEDELFFTFEYCSKLFKKETIERFIIYFNNIITNIVENKNRRISGLTILTEAEKNRILFEFNNTGADYPQDKTIQQLFAEQAERTADGIAVYGRGQTGAMVITYHQLHEQSNRLAHLLIEKGVGPDTIVAIMMERSVEMIIGILGILKSGGAYLPIDTLYPKERIDYMLKDSSTLLLLKLLNNRL
ncbi:MAG TPA: condensation domain-containing protein, partial [Candidatus Kapabacteria bacterium]|nr:condensation domain-containing protein [Candidatus Kapabacteria bacterium]